MFLQAQVTSSEGGRRATEMITHEFNHCTFVKPSVARILFASGENEYQAANEQPEASHTWSESNIPSSQSRRLQKEAQAKKKTRPCLSIGLKMGSF